MFTAHQLFLLKRLFPSPLLPLAFPHFVSAILDLNYWSSFWIRLQEDAVTGVTYRAVITPKNALNIPYKFTAHQLLLLKRPFPSTLLPLAFPNFVSAILDFNFWRSFWIHFQEDAVTGVTYRAVITPKNALNIPYNAQCIETLSF